MLAGWFRRSLLTQLPELGERGGRIVVPTGAAIAEAQLVPGFFERRHGGDGSAVVVDSRSVVAPGGKQLADFEVGFTVVSIEAQRLLKGLFLGVGLRLD